MPCGDDERRVLRPRLGDRTLPRHALLQQQLGGLHARIGMEAAHHQVAGDRVGERDQRHAGVMREERR